MLDGKYKTSSPTTRSQSSSAKPLRSYSTLPVPATTRTDCMTAAAKRYKYLRRLFRFKQMDFEFAMWQMIYLLIAPQRVYRDFQYRKQTKSQYARDDPAFLVLMSFWLIFTSIVFSLVLHFSFSGFILLTLYVIFVDFITAGVIVATLFWFVINRYMRKNNCGDQDVEWGYAFDIHINAFFPSLLILHMFQLIFDLLFNISHGSTWWIGLLFGNTCWLISIFYYIYITFLGYSSIPILKNTNYLLVPSTILLIFYVLSISLGWNINSTMIEFYRNRAMY